MTLCLRSKESKFFLNFLRLQVSVEDTPETTGEFAKKPPAFRIVLIEVSRNVDGRSYEWKPDTLNKVYDSIE